jgi:hypothetical protein
MTIVSTREDWSYAFPRSALLGYRDHTHGEHAQ